MTTDNREDYLISILRLTEGETSAKTTELAMIMDVSPASVSEMLKILSKEGYVLYEKYKGVKLTDFGLNYARQLRKRHHIVERFLMEVLNVDEDLAHLEACKMEHALSDESAVKICQMIGAKVDEDCQSCISPCRAVSSEGMMIMTSIIDLKPGDEGVISHIKNSDANIVKKLITMGFVPGRSLKCDSSIPEQEVTMYSVNGNVLALDSNMAKHVFVDTST